MAIPDNVTLKPADASQARALFEPICKLYDIVFSQPPFNWTDDRSAAHRNDLERLVANPSFGATTAHVGTELVGFGYGVSLRPDTRWWQGAVEPLAADLTVERPGRTFAVIDFGVHRAYRRQGIGRALLEMLLATREEERATLAVRPTATAAQEFYRRLGWWKVGRVAGAPGEPAPFFDLYVLPLKTTP
ncbi:MAG: GNAT family N-acetyltransferase [Pseudonocardiaceae bacterium]